MAFTIKTSIGNDKFSSSTNGGYQTGVLVTPTVGSAPGEPAIFSSNLRKLTMINFGTDSINDTEQKYVLNLAGYGMSEYARKGCFDVVNWFAGSPNATTPGFGTPTSYPGKVTETGTILAGQAHTTRAGNIEQGVAYTYNVHMPLHSTGFTVYGFRDELDIPVADQAVYAHYGASMAVGGNKIFVGAPGAKSTTTYLSPALPSTTRWANANSTTGARQGAVYVYDFKGDLIDTLTGSGKEASEFGSSIAVDPYGRLWVGSPGDAPGSNGAYAEGSVWIFGCDLPISSQGDNTVNQGGFGSNYVPGGSGSTGGIYDRNTLAGDRFGDVIKIIGDRAFVSAPGANGGIGTVHMYSCHGAAKYIGEMGPPLKWAHGGPNGEPAIQGFGTWIEGDGTHVFVGTTNYGNDGYNKIYVYDTASGIYLGHIDDVTGTYFGTYRSMARSNSTYLCAGFDDMRYLDSNFVSYGGQSNLAFKRYYSYQNCSAGHFTIGAYVDTNSTTEHLEIIANTRSIRPRDYLLTSGSRWKKFRDTDGDVGYDWQLRSKYGG